MAFKPVAPQSHNAHATTRDREAVAESATRLVTVARQGCCDSPMQVPWCCWLQGMPSTVANALPGGVLEASGPIG
jgi:hypothetical protein